MLGLDALLLLPTAVLSPALQNITLLLLYGLLVAFNVAPDHTVMQ